MTRSSRTTASFLKVVAAVGKLQTSMVAVAWFVVRGLDNCIQRLLLYDTAGIPALTTKLCGATTSGSGHVNDQKDQRGDDYQRDQDHVLLPPHPPPPPLRDFATLMTLLSPPPR